MRIEPAQLDGLPIEGLNGTNAAQALTDLPRELSQLALGLPSLSQQRSGESRCGRYRQWYGRKPPGGAGCNLPEADHPLFFDPNHRVSLLTVGAIFATRGLAELLHGTSPTDVDVYLAVAGVVMVVALVASWIPALRASRVDPLDALRTS